MVSSEWWLSVSSQSPYAIRYSPFAISPLTTLHSPGVKPAADALRIGGIGAHRHGEAAVIAQMLFHHLGMAMQPAHAGAVRRVEHQVEGDALGGEMRVDRIEQGGKPLPGQRRRQHR